jgi:hypothetical protein
MVKDAESWIEIIHSVGSDFITVMGFCVTIGSEYRFIESNGWIKIWMK